MVVWKRLTSIHMCIIVKTRFSIRKAAEGSKAAILHVDIARGFLESTAGRECRRGGRCIERRRSTGRQVHLKTGGKEEGRLSERGENRKKQVVERWNRHFQIVNSVYSLFASIRFDVELLIRERRRERKDIKGSQE